MNISIDNEDILLVLEVIHLGVFDVNHDIYEVKRFNQKPEIISTYDELYKLNMYIQRNQLSKNLTYQVWAVSKEHRYKEDMWLNVPHNL